MDLPSIDKIILENMSEAVYVRDLDMNLIYVNPAAEKLSGFAKQDALGMKCFQVFGDEGLTCRDACPVEEALAKGIPILHHEGKLKTRSGELKDLQVSISPVSENGSVNAAVVALQDITNWRQVEETHLKALLELEQERSMFMAGPVVIFKWEATEGWPVEFVSRNVETVTGYSQDELVKGIINYSDLIAEEDRERVGEEVAHYSQNGCERFMHQPYRLIKKDGSKIWLADYTSILRDRSGAITHYLGYIIDVTSLKEAERALSDSEKRYRVLVENANEGIAVAQDGKFCWINPRMLEIWGHSKEDITSRPLFDFVHPDDRDMVRERHERRLAGEDLPWLYSFRLITAQGETVWVELSVVRIDWHGRPGTLCYFTNITERKRQEDLLAARLRLSEFESEHSIEELLRTFINEAERLTESKIGFFHFVHEDQESLSLQAWSSNTLESMCIPELEAKDYPIAQAGVWLDCVRERRPVIHNDYMNLPRKKGMPEGHTRVIRELVVPVSREGKIKAVLGVGNKPDDYLGSDVEIVSVLADLAWDIVERIQAQEALRESEERLKNVFESIPTGIFVIDPKTRRIIEVNSTALEMIGGSREEVLGRVCHKFVCPAEENHCPVTDNQEKVERSERELLTISGERRPVLKSVVTIVQDGRELLLESFVDITENKQAEAALRESEEKYRNTMDSSLVGIFVIQDGVFKYVNPAMAGMFGHKPEEMLEREAFHDFIAPEQREYVRQNIVRRAAGEPGRPYDIKCVRRDGTTFDAMVWGAPSVHQGRPASVGTLVDITERKQAETALRESEEKYRNTMESSLVGMYIIQDGVFKYVNSAMAAAFGYKPEEMQEKIIAYETVTPEQREMVRQNLKRRAAGELGKPYEIKCVRRDGTVFDAMVWGAPIIHQGRPASVGSLLDITEHKQTEEEKNRLKYQLVRSQKMQALGTLASGIAHDFNNILAAIMGNSEWALRNAQQGKATTQELEKILEASERAKMLVRQILTYGRQIKPELKPVSLNRLVSNTLSLVERIIPKMITMEISLEKDLPQIKGDPTQIEQILLNLATNAKDAMPSGGNLSIRTKIVPAEKLRCSACFNYFSGQFVLLSVSDTGHGMNQETLRRVFDPFFTTKELGKGTGLGLSTVLGILSGHDAHIVAYSQEGEGTTFNIYFPPMESHKVVEPSPASFSAETRGGHEKIMLVDDEDSLLQLVSAALGEAGYSIQTAGSGEEALEIYRNQGRDISCLIMDLGMPGMGGLEALKELLALDSKAKVIVASGYTSSEEVKRALDCGAAGFVAKPFRLANLLETLRTTLDGK